jgi:hypothetical protein
MFAHLAGLLFSSPPILSEFACGSAFRGAHHAGCRANGAFGVTNPVTRDMHHHSRENLRHHWSLQLRLTEIDQAGGCPKMPRYFFNIVDDDRTIVDSQGVELTDVDEARPEAVISARAGTMRQHRSLAFCS